MAADDTDASAAEAQALIDRNVRLVLGAVIGILLLASLGQFIIATALPVIVADLGGLDQLSWAMASYLLAATVAAPLFGKLGDMFGRKIVLQAAIVIFLAGSIIAAMSNGMPMLVGARLIQGLGGGGLIVSAIASIADVLPPRQRARVQGYVGSIFGLSTLLGPLLGGIIVEQASWRWVFLVNVPLGLMAFVVIGVAFGARPRRTTAGIDFAGAALLTTALSTLVLYASFGGTYLPWLSLPAMALLAVFLVSVVGFVYVEGRAKEPILPLFLFRNNTFLVCNAIGIAVGVVMFGAITFIPFYLQAVRDLPPTQAGLGLVPMMVGLMTASAISGWVMSRTGHYRILPIVSTLLLCLGASLLATIGRETPLWLVAAYLVLLGFGIGPNISVSVMAIQNAVPQAVIGVGTASANMFRQIGGSLGVALLGAILANGVAAEMGARGENGVALNLAEVAALSGAARESVLDAYVVALHPVFWACAAAALLAFAISWALVDRPLRERIEPTPPDPV